MYVWEEWLRETTWEQDCFKFSLENSDRRQLSGVLWKLIPCSWTRMWKRPFSEFRPKSRLDVTRRVGGAQTKWTWWCICRLQHVGEARRAATVVYIVHRQAQLVFNSWANRKPVQLAQMGSDVFVIWKRRRWAVRRRSGLFEVAGVSTGEGPPTPTYCMIQWLGLPSRKGDIELLKTVAKCKEQMIFFYDKNITRRVYTAQYG